jgi:hypothetical protein
VDAPVPVESEDDDAAADGARQRTDPRESMMLMATMVAASTPDEPIQLRVRNLSAGGLMGESVRKLAKGERVELELRGIGQVLGEIAWCGGGKVGVRFDRPIDPKATRKQVGTGIANSRMIIPPEYRRPGLRIG